VRFKVAGSSLYAKAWPAASPEPAVWQVTATDTELAAPGGVGLRTFTGSGNTSTLPMTVAFDDFTISDTQTFTVTRSVNGVSKSHAAGTPVSLAYPAIASL
jgi:hypothetical protein